MSAPSDHHHHHHHHHPLGQPGHELKPGQDFSQHNQEIFDAQAEFFATAPWIEAIGAQETAELQENLEWMGFDKSKKDNGKLLDYAAGMGVGVLALAPYFSFVCGMDISAKMLEQFDKRVKAAGYSEPHIKAVQANLLDASTSSSPELQDPLLQDFDMALIGLALHHIDDVDGILSKIVERLRPGGTLVVVDLAGDALKEMPQGHGIAHSGWTEPTMREIFERLGLENWGWKPWKKALKMPDGEKTAFIARGVKPRAS